MAGPHLVFGRDMGHGQAFHSRILLVLHPGHLNISHVCHLKIKRVGGTKAINSAILHHGAAGIWTAISERVSGTTLSSTGRWQTDMRHLVAFFLFFYFLFFLYFHFWLVDHDS